MLRYFCVIHRDPDSNEFKSSMFFIDWSMDCKNMFTQYTEKYLIPDNQQNPTYYIYKYSSGLFIIYCNSGELHSRMTSQRYVTTMKRIKKSNTRYYTSRCSEGTICQMKKRGRAGIERYFRGEILLYIVISPGRTTTTCITVSEQMPRSHLKEVLNIAQRP